MEYQDMIEKEIATHARMIQGGPLDKISKEWEIPVLPSSPFHALVFAMNKILIREIGVLRQQVADLQEIIQQDAATPKVTDEELKIIRDYFYNKHKGIQKG